MQYINELHIKNVRNIKEASLYASPYFNIILGQNGSGKTSLLEAIFYLGRGRSFRSHRIDPIIHHQENSLTVFAQIYNGNTLVPCGIERHRNGLRQLRLNHETIDQYSQLLQILALQYISTENHRFFYDGSKVRRQFLDWGVFHVEPIFFNLWKEFQLTLKQRNSSIKKHQSLQEISVWDYQFVELAQKIDQLRSQYIDDLKPILSNLLQQNLSLKNFAIHYENGWQDSQNHPLNILKRTVQKDIYLGYTSRGPHRADIQIKIENNNATDYLSQGQLKTLSYCLMIAQAELYKKVKGFPPIFLIDDLMSELDVTNQSYLLR